jgi:hypothetical protein
MSTTPIQAAPAPDRDARHLATALSIGGVCGLAWAAGLRGAMAALAGPDSTVSWAGTFAWILLPGAAVGVLLGWAEHLRRAGGRRGWRRLALSPLLFAAVLFSDPAGLPQLLQDGLGGGALAVPLYGMLGGYALSARGPFWARILARAVLLAPVPAAAVLVLVTDTQVTPHGAWVSLYFYSFMLVLAIASAIPHRPARPSDDRPDH